MFTKTLWRAFWFVALGACFACFVEEKGFASDSNEALLHVAVHNDAGVGAALVAGAEKAAGRIFGLAGLRVEWVNCGRPGESEMEVRRCAQAEYPTHLQLRILARPRNVTATTFGISYVDADGRGCYSEIFAEQAEDLEADAGLRSVILGHVMAHELAHLLLGTNSHALAGIMRARWQAADFRSVGKEELLFSAKESEVMRVKVALELNARNAIASRDTASAD